jgi:hypothetical protein
MSKMEDNNIELEYYPPPDRRKRPPIPLVPSTVVRRKWTGTMPDKFIAAMVKGVSDENIKKWVHELSAFPTRHSRSIHINQVAAWIADRFKEIGYAEVMMHDYTRQGNQLKNVICTKPGSGDTGQIVLLCGHYDCVMEDWRDAASRAPGADDDATGIAVLLELARLMAHMKIDDTVQFAAFSGEEQGLWGSTAYSQHVMDNNINIHRLINLDMLGYPDEDLTILIEQDKGNRVPDNDQPSHEFGELMAQMAADYTDLPVKFGPIYSSDYMPFEARGYVVIGAFEGGENPHYHTGGDSPSTINYQYTADLGRIVLATLLYETASVIDESKSQVDVFIRDNLDDRGEQPNDVPQLNSPDIWVRNNPAEAEGEDPEEGHQSPIEGVPNYLYVRVHNRGSKPANGFFVSAFRSEVSPPVLWPDHFSLIDAISLIEPVPAGGSVRAGPFVWTPQIQDSDCLMAIASGPGDHAISDVYTGSIDCTLLARFDNNVALRIVRPQD